MHGHPIASNGDDRLNHQLCWEFDGLAVRLMEGSWWTSWGQNCEGELTGKYANMSKAFSLYCFLGIFVDFPYFFLSLFCLQSG